METPLQILANVSKAISEGTLADWDFVHIPTEVFTRFAITADRIRTHYMYKLALKDDADTSPRLHSFTEAFHTTTFAKTSGHIDV